MLELPDDLVGKMIEVIAFSVEEDNGKTDVLLNEDRVIVLKNKLKHFTINSGGYRFNRDEANDYE